MSKTEWYRRTTWTDQDREEFNSRLKRSRGASNKAQYLCIQAQHLADAGQLTAAVELLDRYFAEYPEEQLCLPSAHGLKAECLDGLGQLDSALQEYRAAIQIERQARYVSTNVWLDFGWLVVKRQLSHHYEEVSNVLDEFREKTEEGLTFPAIEYRYFAIQAMLAKARGDWNEAQELARKALAEADKDDSGLRYHPRVGLVGKERAEFELSLKALAAM
jgi:tetratricopeptide (TPR) repeat protein